MEESVGYAGKILFVDLTTGRIRKEELDPALASRFVGGWGMNAQLAYELIEPGLDPLSPQMPLIFGAGVLTGTPCPSTPKAFLTTRCPATGTVSTAVGGGYFGTMLKAAGYDHLVITGRAPSPLYLRIADDEVSLCDASQLWGLDLYQATDALREQEGRECSIACIGPAGENLVKISIVLLDKCATLGRSNAASMGAKNLKAILVRGSRGIKVSQPRRFLDAVEKIQEAALKDPLRRQWMEQGLFFVFGAWSKAGNFLHRNFSETYPEKEALALFGPEQYLKVRKAVFGCPSCLTPDKCLLELKEGEFAGLITPASTGMEPAMTFGMRGGAENMNRAVKLFDQANRLGIDMVTFTALFDFALELRRQGILSEKDCYGLEMKPGFETLAQLLEMTSRRQGLGEVLAEGWNHALKRWGKEAEHYSPSIKGTDPDFDARVSFGVETFSAVTNPRAAHDLPVGGLTVAKGRRPEFFQKLAPRMGIPQEAMERVFAPPGFHLGRFTAHYENWATLLNCLGVCFRMQSSRLYDLDTCAELCSSATGMETSPRELLLAAERAFNLYKMANVREGFSRKDDRFPDKWFQPLKRPDRGEELVLKDYFGTATVSKEETERLLDGYYQERGWEVRTGIPTREKLLSLGLEKVARERDLRR